MCAKRAASKRPNTNADQFTLNDLVTQLGGRPAMDFYWKQVGEKRRLIGHPNKYLRVLHARFDERLRAAIRHMGDDGKHLRQLPSACAFVRGANPTVHAKEHAANEFFYITDLADAYPSIDLARLAMLLTYVARFDEYRSEFSLAMLSANPLAEIVLQGDPMYQSVLEFLECYCAGMYGKGLAVGGPLSPRLFNLYCEAYLDRDMRGICRRQEIVYTRYADDLVFSRDRLIGGDTRRTLRQVIAKAGFSVNHRKSQVLSRKMGTVFVTKVGLASSHEKREEDVEEYENFPYENDPPTCSARLVFPQRKRRQLHGLIGSYLSQQMDWPEKVSGFVAQFLYYYKNVEVPTATDRKTFQLCRKFEEEWKKYRKYHYRDRKVA